MASNNIVKIIEAAGKRKAAENEFKVAVAKARVESELRRKENAEKTKQEFLLKQQQERIDNPQKYTPEQLYLKRRFMEQNPLAALMVPEEGAQGQIGISYPTDEVVRDPKAGTYSPQPITQDRQSSLLLQKVDQMLAEGKRPHPAIMKVAEAMRARQQETFGKTGVYVTDPNKGTLTQAGSVPEGSKVYKTDAAAAGGKYTGADAKIVSQAESLTGKLESLKTMVGTTSENYAPFGIDVRDPSTYLGGEAGQEFQTLTDDIKSTLLYLRSGAAVTPQEYKRLSNLLPKLFRKAKVDKSQIDRFIDEFTAIEERIKQGRRYDEKAGTFYTAEGFSPEGNVSKEITASNPETGEKIVLRNGEWVPLNAAA